MSQVPAPDGVAVVKGCPFPLRLAYDVPNHMWYEPLGDGRIRCGMTVVAAVLADNRVFAFTPKRVGRDLERGRACATIESSKWVGPARIAFDGVVDEVNEALIDRPGALVDDPYRAGWMLVARPAVPDALAGLVAGDGIAAAYARWMADNDFRGCSEGEL